MLFGKILDQSQLSLSVLGLEINQLDVEFFSFLGPSEGRTFFFLNISRYLLVLIDCFPLLLQLWSFPFKLFEKLLLLLLELSQFGFGFIVYFLLQVLHLLLLFVSQFLCLILKNKSNINQKEKKAVASLLHQSHSVCSYSLCLLNTWLQLIVHWLFVLINFCFYVW